MFVHQGIWLPDGEKHFPDWMDKNGELVDGRGTYQIRKLRAALEHCRNFRVAIDVGAHVGLWSMQLAKWFDQLHAFEPVAEYRECWTRNMEHVHSRFSNAKRARLHPVALGAQRGTVAMKIPELDGGLDTGGTHVGGAGEIPMYRFDDMIANGYEDLIHVDFMKIDCEGYEHHVIDGARETLLRCKPCVIVEQKPHKLGPNFGLKGTPAVDALKALGANVVREISGDYVMTWPA